MVTESIRSGLAHVRKLVPLGLSVALLAWSSAASAQDKPIGGHVGIALPLVTLADPVTDISDQFTILTPIGIGFKTSEHIIVDFEMVVASPVDPAGTTGLVVDPGVIYDWGSFATGLRAAFQINNKVNFGLIPLINVGLADLGGAKWFVEAAFPTFYVPKDVSLTIVAHTGVGF